MPDRRAVFDLDPEEFRALGHRLVDRVGDLLATLGERRVAPATTPESMRALLGATRPLPEQGTAAGALLDEAAELLLAHSTFNGHPRFFGYITASAAPLGVLGEMLAAAVNPNCGAWALSPAATEIERQTVRWIAELVGYGPDCGGLLVSGGNVANLTCFLAAVQARAGAARHDAGGRREPASGFAVYASAEAHTWVQKAVDVSGLGRQALRWIATDAEQRLDPEALRRSLRADRDRGIVPLVVVGTAGTVSTGAVDPLRELAGLCREHDVWFHVDGAYGAPAAVLGPAAPPDLLALGAADSLAVDPHKWLYAPLEAGCALVRDLETLRRAFAHRPPYYHFGGDAPEPPLNFYELGLQNSRGFRALKVWLSLRHAGRDGYRRAIAEDVALARLLHEHVAAHPDLEPHTCVLSINTFRVVPPDLRTGAAAPECAGYLDRLNREVLTVVQRGGQAYLSNAVLGGRFVLRACIVNFRTREADVRALPDIVARAGRELDARLRPAALRR
jgi:glutamate/tyrosine decarboxylase-like PLP-dependent enzyme